MIRDKQVLSLLLRQLSEVVDTLDESDFEKIVDGRLELTLSQTRSQKKDKPRSQDASGHADGFSKIRERLSTFSSRDDAERYLSENVQKKADLVLLARDMEIPIHSTDTGEKIRDKIVDSTVGYKLRSQAIRGES